MKKIIFAFAFTAFFVCGCVTPYQPMGLEGGYSDVRLNKNTYLVRFKGNGFTDKYELGELILRRAADLTAQNGYRYFYINSGKQDVDSSVIYTPGKIETKENGNYNLYGNRMGYNESYNGTYIGNSTTEITAPNYRVVNRYSDTILIRMYQNQNKNQNFIEAKIILNKYSKK
jgi:hypothetical protein